MAEEDRYDEGVAYWDKRYTNEPKPSDWVLKPSDGVLENVVYGVTCGNRQARILHVGCGNSLVAEALYDQGYKNIVNIDNSSVVIEQMRQRNSELRPELEWLVLDATATGFPDGHFDLVLDKALLDTLVCEDDEVALIGAYFKEFTRVMSVGGAGLVVCFGSPEDREHWFPDTLDVRPMTVQAKAKRKVTGSQITAYVCRRRDGLPLPDLSSRRTLCEDPLVLQVPFFLPLPSCEALARMALSLGPSEAGATQELSASDERWPPAERALLAAVEAAVGELVGQPLHGAEPALVPAAAGDDGLRVDAVGGGPRRFASASLCLGAAPGGLEAVFPVALEVALQACVPCETPSMWGAPPSDDDLGAARLLVDQGVGHTLQAVQPAEQAAAGSLAAAAEAGSGLVVAMQQGTLVVSWCRRADGSVCPRSWHGIRGAQPAGEDARDSGLLLRKFKDMPEETLASGAEGVAAYLGRTRGPHLLDFDPS